MTVNMKADSNSAAGVGGGSQASSISKESDTVKALKKQIEQLQKQLQAQQQALQEVQSSDQSAEAKAAAVAAAQTQIAGTAAALQTVTSALLQAVTDEGNSTSGSMVNTTA
jgi:chromosome segregation ATPase